MPETQPPFRQSITLRWSDLDPNGHVRHSVYYDWGAMLRIAYLDSKGVGIKWMAENGIGPVLFREEAKFLRELHHGDELAIDFQLSGASPDGRKWKMRHRIFRGADIAATVEVDGAWLDLRARRIVVPPEAMARAFEDTSRSEDFVVLTSSKASGG
ncbi:MAG TPA: thioesterase family protein [Polyangia bacterium]|jgi:acyl-CoA thioester hydrolase